ncbi:MAG: hypothetical protein AAGA42_11185 [Actinomycetota bacterium]
MKKPTTIMLLCCGTVALTGCGTVLSSSSPSNPHGDVDEVEVVEVETTEVDGIAADDVDVETIDVDGFELDGTDVLGATELGNQSDGVETDTSTPSDTNSSDTSDDGTSDAGTSSNASGDTSAASSSAAFAGPFGAAGAIELHVSGTSVTLGAFDLNQGWSQTSNSSSTSEVDIDVQSATTKIDLEADVNSSGVLEVDVDTYWELAAGSYVEPTIAGNVTVVYNGSGVSFGSIELNDGWSITSQTDNASTIEVIMANQSNTDTVRLTAEVDDGRGEIDTRNRIAVNS